MVRSNGCMCLEGVRRLSYPRGVVGLELVLVRVVAIVAAMVGEPF